MKQNDLIRKRDIAGKRNEETKEFRQCERNQNKGNKNEDDIDMGSFFETATSDNKTIVNRLKIPEVRNEILSDYTGDFEMTGDIIIGDHKQTKSSRFKNVMIHILITLICIMMLLILYLLVSIIN